MGKNSKPAPNLGRSLIKDRFGGNQHRKLVDDKSMLHTTELQDGYDWNRLNLQSVTEESSFQEFLSKAELTGAEFEAEKLDIKFINPRCNVGLLSADQVKAAKSKHEEHKALLAIPRRPPWTTTMSRQELDQKEREYFSEWRRNLAQLQEDDGILITPYEKNLEFWRQLWRVVEKSDVVVQIVDARNPLLFRCEDLEQYVKEVSPDKLNMILVNKADLLTEKQREIWAAYFSSIGLRVVFYSALYASEADKNEESEYKDLKEQVRQLEEEVERTAEKLGHILEAVGAKPEQLINSKELLTKQQLTQLLQEIHQGPKVTPNLTTIGLVGYPNVGKSSTINSLLSMKKVSVSATPGKTKHFQTIFLTKDLLLCDCPGLVTPSFVFTKADMILNGILPIDQMRDHVPPVNLVCSLLPKHVLEDTYGIILPKPMEGDDPGRSPTSEELLNSYAYNRGFMTANGQPDNPRAARYILKDYMNGKLLYCHAPPNVKQEEFHDWPERVKTRTNITPQQARAVKLSKPTTEDVDKMFFQKRNEAIHIKGKPMGMPVSGMLNGDLGEKPWKKINKHANKNKREKLRRVYAHLDQH